MTSVVVSDGGGNIVEYVTVVEEPTQVSLYYNPTATGKYTSKPIHSDWHICIVK